MEETCGRPENFTAGLLFWTYPPILIPLVHLGVWAKIRETLPQIVNYPDPESKQLRSQLASEFQLPIKKIMVGNGAGELLFTLLQALKPGKVAIPIPSFSEYEQASRAAAAEIFYIPLGARGWSGLPPVIQKTEKALIQGNLAATPARL